MSTKEGSNVVQKNFYCNKKTRAAIAETAARLGITESILIESAVLIFLSAPQDRQYELIADFYRWLGQSMADSWAQKAQDTTPPARPPE